MNKNKKLYRSVIKKYSQNIAKKKKGETEEER